MNFITTAIEGLLIIEPTIHRDARGYFYESYSKREFEKAVGRSVDFVQDNESCSSRGVIRGLHYQRGEWAQAKLVRCVNGSIIDIALDLRPDSPTFGQHVAVELSEDNHRALFIPRGFAHGFAVVSERAIFQYKCDNYYKPESEGGINPLDPSLGINWTISAEEAILSQKDINLPDFQDAII